VRAALETAANASDRILKFALVVLMGVLVLSITWQVASRYMLRDPSSWTEEIARFALIWAGFLGTVYAYRSRGHVAINVLVHRLSDTWANRAGLLAAFSVIAFALPVLAIGGANIVLITAELEQTSAALGLQMSWVYAVIPVSGLLLILYAIHDFVRRVGGASVPGKGRA